MSFQLTDSVMDEEKKDNEERPDKEATEKVSLDVTAAVKVPMHCLTTTTTTTTTTQCQETTPWSPMSTPSWPLNALVGVDAAYCQRSRSVCLADGSIRTRVRTRTHRSHEDSPFWYNGQSASSEMCHRTRSVRLANGSIRTRVRTVTHRTQESPFWNQSLDDSTATTTASDEYRETMRHSKIAKGAPKELVVHFGEVRVREYERVIDSTDKFMGLALGWNWFQETTQDIPDKEEDDEQKPVPKRAVSVSEGHDEPTHMRKTNGNERYSMLVRYGFGARELKQATKEAHTFYKQRTREREEARSLVVAEYKQQQFIQNHGHRPLLRSSFGI